VDDSHVVKVTNDNAEEVLSTTTADVMIEFYAPWYALHYCAGTVAAFN
jgi:hypothetical protein